MTALPLLRCSRPGAPEVAGIIREIADQEATGYISAVNLGEVYSMLSRKTNKAFAEASIVDIRGLPITVVDATTDDCLETAKLKAGFPISNADAFAALLTIQLKGHGVTGDPEFLSLIKIAGFRLRSIPPKPKKK